MTIDYTLPPSLALIQINGIRGSDQLRAAADIIDAVAQGVVPERYVLPYCGLVSDVLTSVHVRMIAATHDTQRDITPERCRCL